MYNPSIGFYVLPGILLYLLDKALRGWQYTNSTYLIPGQDIIQSKGVITIALDWEIDSWMKTGQTVYLTMHSTHKLQAHPFSIAAVSTIEGRREQSVIHEEEDPESQPVTSPQPTSRIQTLLHIKAGRGQWTTSLSNHVKESKESLQCLVEGPYDHLPRLPAHNVVVFVAGGLGITPILGILRQWIAHPSLTPSICYLIWTSRSFEEICLLDSALIDIASSEGTGSWLRLHIHFTGQREKIAASPEREKDGSAMGSPPPPLKPEISEPESRSILSSSSSFWTLRSSLYKLRRSSTSSISPEPPSEDAQQIRSDKTLLVAVASDHPILYLFLAILCFAGAYAGLQVPTWYDLTHGHASNWFGLGVMYVCCLMAGSMIPPILALVAFAALRKFLSVSNSNKRPQSGSWEGGVKDLMNSTIQQDTNGGLRLFSRLSGFSVPLNTRRPELKAVLAMIKTTHVEEIEIPVLVGGPEVLMEAARNEIEEQNGVAGCYFWFRKVTCL